VKYFICCLLLMLVPRALMAQTLPGGFRGAYVEGNVMDGAGKPIVGAKVDVIGAKVKKNSVKEDDGCGTGFAMSAANGDFAVGVGQNNLCVDKKHPINGKYYVSVSKRGYLPQQKVIDFGIQKTNAIGAVEFVLILAHASVQGQVVGPDGKGLPYAYAWLMKDPFAMMIHHPKGHVQVLSSELPMVRTDANGKFTIPVSPGNYVVMAAKSGYQLMTKTVNPSAQQMYEKLAANPYMTPQVRAKLQEMDQPQLGVYVSVATDGVASADLGMVKASPSPAPPGMMKVPKFAPYKVYLVGQPRSSPNNVLFFTAQALGGSEKGPAALDVVRSRTLLGSGKANPFAAHVKTFNFELYGFPGRVGCQHRPGHVSRYHCEDEIFSFTDATAKSGVTYFYYIFEGPPVYVSPGGKIDLTQVGAPYSNAWQIVTH